MKENDGKTSACKLSQLWIRASVSQWIWEWKNYVYGFLMSDNASRLCLPLVFTAASGIACILLCTSTIAYVSLDSSCSRSWTSCFFLWTRMVIRLTFLLPTVFPEGFGKTVHHGCDHLVHHDFCKVVQTFLLGTRNSSHPSMNSEDYEYELGDYGKLLALLYGFLFLTWNGHTGGICP